MEEGGPMRRHLYAEDTHVGVLKLKMMQRFAVDRNRLA
jgi:hypothetical protein